MNSQTVLQIQAIELRQLLEGAATDPILGPQLRERLSDVEMALEASRQSNGTLWPKENAVLPRAAIFLRGGGVEASKGIRPGLAGEALIQYEKMFTEQALHDERESAKNAGRQRRRRGSARPGLLFTGTPRGSFGLEFTPLLSEDNSLLEVHARSLANVSNALSLIAEGSTKGLNETIRDIPAGVLQPLKKFMKTLADYGAELRFAFPDRPSRSLSVTQVQTAADRLEKEVSQETIEIRGTFRGVTRESGIFDLKTGEGEVVTGTVADEMTEDDLERIDLLTNHPCVARIQKTMVTWIIGATSPSYVLEDAQPTAE